MVTVKDVKTVENNQGEEFFGLIVESGAMPVKSKATGRLYFTAKTAFVPCTFDEDTANSLIGTQFDGEIMKVPTEPYDYTIEETGEVITMNHRWEYSDPALDLVEEQVVEKTAVF